MCRFAAPFTVIWATSWFMDRAHALTDLQGKTSKFLLVYGARAAPRGRGVATLGAGLAPSFVEGFGAYIPDDDPEPDRAKDCKELKTAEECRAEARAMRRRAADADAEREAATGAVARHEAAGLPVSAVDSK